ncbi:MAG: diphthamide biosynthesis enzyme Dph2 [archaeon]
MLEFNLKKAFEEINRVKPKLILLQFPEGLKQRTTELIEEIKKKSNTEVIVLLDPCFGACDLAEEEAKLLEADLIIHFGHEKFLDSGVKTVYVPLEYRIDENELREGVKKLIDFLKNKKWDKIALASTIQFSNTLKKIKKELEKNNFSVFVGKGDKRIARDGVVLGCNYSAVREVEGKVKATVFIGDGAFHPLGIAFNTEKEVISFNPLNLEIKEMKEKKERFERKRFGVIARAKNAEIFGIILSTKKGQLNKGIALKAKKEIEGKGKKAFLLAMDTVKEEYLMGVKVDCLVNTACPRITEDQESFSKPIISVKELGLVLG